MRLIDRTGQRYGRLVVLERGPKPNSPKDTNARWLCQCDCGKTTVAYGQDLKRGKVVSCGCWNEEKRTKHGMYATHVNSVWRQMLDRCRNPKNPRYADYGGRGISVCERWHDFSNFIADMGDRPKGYTLERINNAAGYSPENCKWATYSEQLNNRRNSRLIEFNGKSQTMAEWAKETGIGWHTLRQRLDRLGWSVERALTEKPKVLKRKES